MKLYIIGQGKENEKFSTKGKIISDAYDILFGCGAKLVPSGVISAFVLGKNDYCIFVCPDDDAKIKHINKLKKIKKFNTVCFVEDADAIKADNDSKIIPIKVWDYLMDEAMGKKCDENTEFASKKVEPLLKGNAGTGEFITRQKWNIGLTELFDGLGDTYSENIEYHLWGKAKNSNVNNNSVIYEGKVSQNVLPLEISEKCNLGLVLNGFDSGLYLASGVPVIVLEGSVMAEFVRKEGCGFIVDNLNNIGEILENVANGEYEQIRENVKRVSSKVREGEYLKDALKEAIR